MTSLEPPEILWDFAKFLEYHHLHLRPAKGARWRIVPENIHGICCELKGQPHHGTVIPYFTDGHHAFVKRLHDGTILKVMFLNIKKTPRLGDSSEEKKPTKTVTCARKPSTFIASINLEDILR